MGLNQGTVDMRAHRRTSWHYLQEEIPQAGGSSQNTRAQRGFAETLWRGPSETLEESLEECQEGAGWAQVVKVMCQYAAVQGSVAVVVTGPVSWHSFVTTATKPSLSEPLPTSRLAAPCTGQQDGSDESAWGVRVCRLGKREKESATHEHLQTHTCTHTNTRARALSYSFSLSHSHTVIMRLQRGVRSKQINKDIMRIQTEEVHSSKS